MIIDSLFAALPPVPVTNAHNVFFRPQENEDLPQFIDGLTGQSISRSDFRTRVFDFATAVTAPVSEGGLECSPANDIVAILSPNAIDYCTFVHAMLVVTVPFALPSFHSTEHELEYLLRKSKSTRLFVHSTLLAKALSAACKVGLPDDKVYLVDQITGDKRQSIPSLIENVRERRLSRTPVQPVQKDTLAYMVFSSGTSGAPKAVMVSHTNIVSSVLSAVAFVEEETKGRAYINVPTPVSARPTALAVLPFFHSFGLHTHALRSLLRPQTMVILPKWNLDVVFKTVEKYKIETMALVPSMVHQILTSPKLKDVDMSSVVWVGIGAAHLPTVLAQRLKGVLKSRTNLPEGYGLSEATIGAMGKPPVPFFDGKLPVQEGSTGILLAGFQVRLIESCETTVDSAGRESEQIVDAKPGEPGELWLRGSSVALGYFGDENATRETFRSDGWLRTGDRFRYADGHFFYEDRMKDVLKVGGSQVSPAEIESCIMTMPDHIVSDVTVIGVQPPPAEARLGADEKWPRAYITLGAAGKALRQQEVIQRVNDWVSRELSSYKRLRGGVCIVNAIPKSPTGKVLRRVFQEQYAKEQRENGARL